uniref:Integrase catalytic domain-containing protein n=1 Tax=Lactuca sativa TaxID=4236 RepID=A0A9R1WTV0_LACSA|nr:hypothetical protein LSAT_V11C900465450 [Lactuca sativa]
MVLPSPRCTCEGCDCGIGKKLNELREKERTYEFLMGLDDEFSVIRTQILAMKPTPPIGSVYHLLAEEEQQRALSGGVKRTGIELSAFQANYNLQRGQRQSTNKTTTQPTDKSTHKFAKSERDKKVKCSFCQREGRSKEGCFKIIGYPEWWPGNKEKPKVACVKLGPSPIPGQTDEQYNLFTEHFKEGLDMTNNYKQPMANMAGRNDIFDGWIVDSGATEHMTHRLDFLFNKIQNSKNSPVVIPSGDKVSVMGEGEHTFPGGVNIKGVLFVPNFNYNLLSVGKLADDLNCAVTFFPGFFVMQELGTKHMIGAGNRSGGLYRTGVTNMKTSKALMSNFEFWHKRLGHPSTKKISSLIFIDVTKEKQFNTCDACLKAKHTRLPFPVSEIKTFACFDLIHCDVWGKYRTPSISKASYFFTIVDDFSRVVWAFLIKHKHEASTCLIGFHKMVQTQFGKQIKWIRCDNGGEFVSNRMRDFYSREGIVLETTCPHTPQQNGVVERKHRHLLETASALRFEANLPKVFWGECILTTTYLINRIPTKVVKGVTPLFNQKPAYEHMRIFGCLVYYRNTETRGEKFEARGKPGLFVGYPPGVKGYRLYDMEKRKIVISRDIRFLEDTFPMASDLANKSITQDDMFVLEDKLETSNTVRNHEFVPHVEQGSDVIEDTIVDLSVPHRSDFESKHMTPMHTEPSS